MNDNKKHYVGDAFIDSIIDGATKPNPEYNPKTKNGRAKQHYVAIDNPPSFDDGIITKYADTSSSLRYTGRELGYTNKDIERDAELGVPLSQHNTEEDLNRARAESQSWLQQAGDAVVQAVGNEVILGSALALSNLVDSAVNIFTDSGENDYTNPVSSWLEGLQDDLRKNFEIYQKDPNASFAIGDFGWWANNAVSIASSASMLLPSTGIVKGLGALSKIKNIGLRSSILAGKAVKAMSLGKIKSAERIAQTIRGGAEIGTTALLSRTMENYLEAREVYNEVKDDAERRIAEMSSESMTKFIEDNPELKGKTTEQIAQYIAGVSADKTFANDYAMLLMDVAQFKALGSLWKGLPNKATTASLRNENKIAIGKLIKKASEESSEKAAKSSFLKNRFNDIKQIITHPLNSGIEFTEGIEEGYQGIQTEKGKEVAEMIFNPEYSPRTIENYLKDSAIWEQAVWGIAGGFGFQKIGKGLGNLYRKAEAYKQYKQGKISKEDFKLNLTSEEKARAEEIKGRLDIIKRLVNDLKLINDYKDPDRKKVDKNGNIVIEDGVDVYETLSPEEAEAKKTKVINDYLTNMAINAVNHGNFDLFKEYVSSAEFDQFFKDAGVNTSTEDKAFSQKALKKAEAVADGYATNLYNVLKNTEIENEHIAKIAAHEITREQLEVDELTEQRKILQDQIDKLNTADISLLDSYRRKNVHKYAKIKLNELADAEQSVYDTYRNHKITKQAYEQYKEDYKLRKYSLVKFLNDNYSLFDKDIKQSILNLLNDAYLGKDVNGIDTTLDKIENLINNEETTGTLTKSVSDIIDKQIVIDDNINLINTIIPKNQEDFIQKVKDVSRRADLLTINRLNEAAKKVEDYIIKQENLNKAAEDVLSNNVPELEKELDLLKIGHTSMNAYTKSIDATIQEEQKRRQKEEQERKKVVVDNNSSSEEKAENIRREIKEIEDSAEKNDNPIVHNLYKQYSEELEKIHDEQDKNKKEELIRNLENKLNPDNSNPDYRVVDSEAGVHILSIVKPIESTSTGEGTKGNTKKDRQDSPEEEVVKATLIDEDVEKLNQAARDAEKIAEAFNISVDEEAIGRASTIAFDIFRTSRHLFDNALGKDFNSEEVQEILKEIINRLEDQGVSVGFAPAAAQRGLRLALGTITRRLEVRKDSKAEQFRKLADSVAAKINLTGDMNAITTTLSDQELDSIIDKLLETYRDYKEISTPKGQKTIINLERLFNDIIYNKEIGIDVETAMHILWNMKDYISNPLNTKYEFTHKRSLNAMLSNPVEFFNSVVEARIEEVQLDNYMHISPVSQRTEQYQKLISGLRSGDEIEIEYNPDRNGKINSIVFKVRGQEIGIISVVTPNSDNTGYTNFISRYKGGIRYTLTKDANSSISSSTDSLFNEVFDQSKELWDIINKYYRHTLNNANRNITDVEAEIFMDNEVIKQAIASGSIVLPEKWDERNRKFVPKLSTDFEKATFILNALSGVVFYDTRAQSRLEYKNSYRQWIKNVFTNYKNTHKIQTALDQNKKIVTKFAGTSNGYNNPSSVASIIDETEHGISEIGLTFDRNPIVGVVNSDGRSTLVNEQTGKSITSDAPFKIGSMGMFVGGHDGNPILAMFTSANKLGDKIKKQLQEELTDVLIGFQEKKYTFEEVSKKLSSLFNGPGINNPTIFQGYSVIKTNDILGLSVGGQSKQFVLVVNKVKKGTKELGTGITYSPNGNKDNAISSISVNKKFIEKIVNEIINNVVYNRTFYTLNNINNDNTSDNPYMYKENGNFVIELGGVKTVYENFGDFVLKENAFNTNQGRNAQGGYFNNTDKANSLYIDVSVLETPSLKSSPVEREYKSVADTIKTASTEKFNDPKELLEKVGVPKENISFLSGENDFGISLIPSSYGYDSKLTKEYAVFRNGKIFFSSVGATYANSSPISLTRLLIHENLHAEFNKFNLFERQGLVEDLMDTYNATIEAIEYIIQTANENSAEFKNAVKVRQWLEDNKFNPTDYFTKFAKDKANEYAALSEEERKRIFVEEWLVETLTQPLLMNFLNNTDYRGQEVLVEGIANENKSIWQKIIDLLLKIFGKGRTNIKNNTIFAQQYLILGNIQNEENTTKQAIDENTITENVTGEDIAKNNEDQKEIIQDEYDDELGLIQQEDEDSEIEDEEIIIEDEIELSATTTTADNYIDNYTDEERDILKNAPRNSEGKLLTKYGKVSKLTDKQYAQVRTKAFKNWFGDWENDPKNASKVVDENGEPLVVYHGGQKGINIFLNRDENPNYEKIKHQGYRAKDRVGIYFSEYKGVAKGYASAYKKKDREVYEVFLNIKNPLNQKIFNSRINTLLNLFRNKKERKLTADLIHRFELETTLKNYDGINHSNGTELIVFNSNQIKSATENIGTFDPDNNDIRYATTTNALDYVLDHIDDDGGATAETFGITRITNMADYINMYAEQDRPLIAKMLENGELKYACK